MKDMETAVLTATQDLIKSGRLTELIAKEVEKTVADVVNRALSSYSPFGKQLEETVKASLGVDMRDLKLEGYNKTVLAVVQQKLDAAIETVGREKLATEMAALLSVKAPAEMKVSELVEKFKEWAKEEVGARGDDRCTIIFEPSEYGMRWLYLDAKPRKEKYFCSFRLLISEHSTSYWIHGIDPTKGLMVGSMHGFARTLFHLYAGGTKLVVDQEDFETFLNNDED